MRRLKQRNSAPTFSTMQHRDHGGGSPPSLPRSLAVDEPSAADSPSIPSVIINNDDPLLTDNNSNDSRQCHHNSSY